MSSLEREFNIFSLATLESSTYWKDIEDLIDWQLPDLLPSFLFRLVLLLDCIEARRVFLQEAPLVAYWHLRDVGQHEVLPLGRVVQDAAKVNVGWDDLQVGEADLTLERHNISMRMVCMRNGQLAGDVVRQSILLHAWIEVDADGFGVLAGERQLISGATEWLVDLESDCCWQGAGVRETQRLGDRHRGDALLPEVFELKALLAEAQAGSDELASDSWTEGNLGFSIASDCRLALPVLLDLSDIEGVRAELHFVSHLGVEHHGLGNDGEDEFGFFIILAIRAH